MGPITLFDKSFLQGLSVDESVWFAHFFIPVICPIFYFETLADLGKKIKRGGRTPEQEVEIIASKFPDASAQPCGYHVTMIMDELHGGRVPMDSTIARTGGQIITVDGMPGLNFDQSMEEAAFLRWQSGEFLYIERDTAKRWRDAVAEAGIDSLAKQTRGFGCNSKTCPTFFHARAFARTAVQRSDPLRSFEYIFALLKTPADYQQRIIQRWSALGKKPLAQYAPYTAYFLEVELFFANALAAHLISSDRPSNLTDIAYLHYFPFCSIFVSSDKLHRKCADQFLRDDQRFVWGPDLKEDLKRINEHFLTFPRSERDRGITFFAHAPPKRDRSIVRVLRAQFLGANYDDAALESLPPPGPERADYLYKKSKMWTRDVPVQDTGPMSPQVAETVVIRRTIKPQRGSWWQVPSDKPA
jgi:hypothetical protein